MIFVDGFEPSEVGVRVDAIDANGRRGREVGNGALRLGFTTGAECEEGASGEETKGREVYDVLKAGIVTVAKR